MPFIEESLDILSGIVVMAGEVLVLVVVVVTFSGMVAQNPSANRLTQARQAPMDFSMSALLSQSGTPRKQVPQHGEIRGDHGDRGTLQAIHKQRGQAVRGAQPGLRSTARHARLRLLTSRRCCVGTAHVY